MAIKILDDKLVSKIAAGEVIERPASIIKELVENSIDAKADEIEIELENGGKKLIKVKDNGCGMNKADLDIVCRRHATSKIKELKDLFDIKTMGFRGEALSSIAAVSNLEIISKTKEDIGGTKIVYDFCEFKEKIPSASNTGTIIIVRNLFEKLPARLKFLKDEVSELKHIMSIITKIALINTNISFSVKNNGKPLLSTQKGSLKNTITSILGQEISRDLLEVNDGCVKGFVSKPILTRSDKSNQYIYINKRPIENKTISDAIYDAYHTLLFLERHPIIVLNITLNPIDFDVNVHPAKKEVRLEHEKEVYELVFNAIKNTFKKNDLIPEIRPEEFQMGLKNMQEKTEVSKMPAFSKNVYSGLKNKYSGFEQRELSEVNTHFEKIKNRNLSDNSNVSKIDESKTDTNVSDRFSSYGETPIPDDFFVMGQIHKTYIVCETKQGISIYDQHATEERINYEKIMQKKDSIKRQMLLEPITLELNPKEMKIVQEKNEEIKKIGFGIEQFGTNTIIVREIPFIFQRAHDAKVVYDIINTFDTAKNKTFEEIQDNIASTMACRASVKAGDILSRTEMTNLIREYKKCRLPYTCPHGRPGALSLSINELEKLFKRTG